MKVIREDLFVSEDSMYDSQFAKGREVEKEHLPTYDRLVDYVREFRKLPPKEWLFDSIAKDHLDLNNPVDPGNPRYYDILLGAGL
jgi:hypothetical protein